MLVSPAVPVANGFGRQPNAVRSTELTLAPSLSTIVKEHEAAKKGKSIGMQKYIATELTWFELKKYKIQNCFNDVFVVLAVWHCLSILPRIHKEQKSVTFRNGKNDHFRN